ncbi:sugar transferase [Pelagibacterium montanilacus]|uniref:sugar transferase n=1 Tax=Pelagibacterium montanilacus TaxID=2185280 RepID=UPI000F8C60AB|nr:sugar transferase [Pelagibacterium montanilacus]
MKRAFDLLAALAGGLLTLPVVLALVLVIRMTSPGPGLFRQVRVGRGEKPFVCLKLRTMNTGTGDRPSHETGAAAITPLGRMLRRTKLDELPQLYNIIKGEMSLVGPRPCLPGQTELIALRREKGLYALRPGITGEAQIRGIDMSDPARLAEADAVYLTTRSLGHDITLILATVTGSGRGDAAK